ncbi:MAG TPA: SurA N-terminal domain-containing protein [Bacteroidales bacterium]|nr:SurA N-terminal domain-containing protein [Bacteroidales bacterium]
MAVISKIRKQSTLLIIIIGVALASFILGDFLNPRKSKLAQQSVNIGVVDGVEITGKEFNNKVEENLEVQRQNSQSENVTSEQAFSIRQSVWDELVSGIIMGKQYDRLGLGVSVDELDDQIRGPEPHSYIMQNFRDPNTGTYDPQTVTNFLQNFNQLDPSIQQRYMMLEKMIKDDRARTKYNNLVGLGYYVPTVFAQKDYEEKNTRATVRITGLKYTSMPDTAVSLTEADYQKYYDEHRGEFKQEPSVDLDYVVFEVLPSMEDRKVQADEITKAYKDFQNALNIPSFVNSYSDVRYDSSWFGQGKLPVRIDSTMFNSPVGTFYPPYLENDTYYMARLMDVQMRSDSLRASHVLIAYQGAQGAAESITRTKEQADRKADSLMNVVKNAVERFSFYAREFSDDPSAEQNGGDLDWFADGAMVPAFNKAVLDGKVGDIVKAETPFGYHIIYITGKKDPVKKVRVALVTRKVEPSKETYQQVFLTASDFATRNNTREEFDRAVVDQGLNKRTADNQGIMSNSIPGIEFPRQILFWAFNEKTEEGNVSQVYDMGKSCVVALLKKRYEKGDATLEAVKTRIEPLVKREKKAEILIGRVQQAVNQSKDISTIARQLNAKVDTLQNINFGSTNLPAGYGPEKDVIGRIFAMNQGQTEGPIKGTQGVYVVTVDAFDKPAVLSDYSQQKKTLFNAVKGRAGRDAYSALLEHSDLEDNRIKFY